MNSMRSVTQSFPLAIRPFAESQLSSSRPLGASCPATVPGIAQPRRVLSVFCRQRRRKGRSGHRSIAPNTFKFTFGVCFAALGRGWCAALCAAIRASQVSQPYCICRMYVHYLCFFVCASLFAAATATDFEVDPVQRGCGSLWAPL